jgi:hypothetical protein
MSAFSAGAYIPLAIGGWGHPSEINIVTYTLWFVLSGVVAYSLWVQDLSGWRLPVAYVVGNGAIVGLGLGRGHFTFNLNLEGAIILYGLVGTFSVWALFGNAIGGRWRVSILLWGSIAADVVSFIPLWLQYVVPHNPTRLTLVGWIMWLVGALISLIWVEKVFEKLSIRENKKIKVLGDSAFAIENALLVVITLVIMTRSFWVAMINIY